MMPDSSRRLLICTFCLLILSSFTLAKDPDPSQEANSDFPIFLADLPNPADFSLFANGGWDGNWYVGYDKCWISKLPPPPPGEYKRAFLGAKLGRMKTTAQPGRPPWEKQPILGEVDIAVASEPLWPQSRRYMLTGTQYIP